MNFWHFEYSFETDIRNRMLFGKIYGVWKVPTAEAYAKEFKEVAKPLLKKPWSKLIDLSNWKIVYPEVIEIIGDLNRWCRNNKMEWAVYIINQKAGYNQLMKMLAAGEYKDITQTFRSLADGEKYLRGQGYSVRKPNENELFK